MRAGTEAREWAAVLLKRLRHDTRGPSPKQPQLGRFAKPMCLTSLLHSCIENSIELGAVAGASGDPPVDGYRHRAAKER